MKKSKVIVKESTGRRIIEQSRVRLLCVGLFFVLCFGSICVRMVEVAVLKPAGGQTITVADADDENEDEQVQVRGNERRQRANIVDRNGVLLATSVMTASLFANPKEIRNPQDTAERLAKTLGMDVGVMRKRLSSGKSFVWIKRNLSPREQDAANRLGIPGLYFLPEEKRIYPYGSLLAHAVGYVGVDNKGLAGLEKQFDADLRDGTLSSDGLQLSVDVRLQAIMREEMKKAVDSYRAIGAMGVIMDLKSGELLSMVSLPDFDPHKPAKSDQARFNRAVQGVYEMGSTFKSFTLAMALDYGTVTMKSGYDATNPFKISSFLIQDTHPKKRWLSVPEIYAYSSNIGTAKMALDVGAKRQKAFLEKLGMMKPVSIELPEKAQPQYPTEWKDINTVTISYGHGFSVSPLHLVQGISALVNDGVMPRLTLLKGGAMHKAEAERVVSEDTSRNMRRLMRLVVDHGTGTKADVAGYRVGGKTGTAEKINAGGTYNADAKIASFVGAFPVDDPRYVVLVMVDEPKGDKTTYGYATGGWISAPVAGRIISRMGPLYGIKPAYDVPDDDAEKFWVDEQSPRTSTPVSPLMQKKYVHATSF